MKFSDRPVLIGVGQMLDRPAELSRAMSPLDMMEATARLAAEDAGLTASVLSQVETLVVVNSVGKAVVDNPPAALAQRLGAGRCAQKLTVTGGNTPQMLVNYYARAIASGETSLVLLAGAEALDTMRKALRSGEQLNWQERAYGRPVLQSVDREGSSPAEKAHGMVAPIVTYPLFENALRHHYGRTFEDHQRSLGELFAPYTDVAAENPYAWFPIRRTAREIAEVSTANRYIGFPYTKYLNAVMMVNQSASVLMTSQARARELGIDESRWVYLRGCADVNDIWNVIKRRDYHSSPALKAGFSHSMQRAEVSLKDIDYFDFYSCFPAIVQISRDAIGLRPDDPRPLTVTGGLPYFGGPGNNYTMHAIASMVDKLRSSAGSVGMVTGNGWYVTKHSIGIYSTAEPDEDFERVEPTWLQQQLDTLEHPSFCADPSGSGEVETFTVLFGRSGDPETGLVVGRLGNGQRFVAHTATDADLLEGMVREDPIGRMGVVTSCGQTNRFEFSD